MVLYLLVTQQSIEGTKALLRLPSLYPDHRAVAENAWVIRSEQTSQEISDALFPRGDETEVKSHIIVGISAFWGWHDRGLWEWMGKREG
jgi:hypothetical protein